MIMVHVMGSGGGGTVGKCNCYAQSVSERMVLNVAFLSAYYEYISGNRKVHRSKVVICVDFFSI